MPENEFVNESIMKIYSKDDYRQLTISKEYNDINAINMLIEKSKDIFSISKYAKQFLHKAKKIVNRQKVEKLEDFLLKMNLKMSLEENLQQIKHLKLIKLSN